MLMLLTQSVANASFGIYFPKFTGTIYELLSAPVSAFEIVLGYVGAAASKSIILGLIILATAGLFVPLRIAHPFWMVAFLVLTAVTFSLLGFIIGIWADGFEKLQVVPLLDHHAVDLSRRLFLRHQRVAALLADGDAVQSRWSIWSAVFAGAFTASPMWASEVSLAMTMLFLVAGLVTVWWIFRTGYKLKS